MESYRVQLDTFEGPLELLLELVEKEELDISDVSLARIADQFLSYITHFEEKEPAHLAEFLVIAAKLILMKSKTLLPSFEVSEEEEKELTELKEKLVEYRKIREGARHIGRLEREHRHAYHRYAAFREVRVFAPPQGVGVGSLRDYFIAVKCAKEREEKALDVERIDLAVSFEEKIKDIKTRLELNLTENFSALYDANAKINVIMAFLVVLELIKQRFLRVEQDELFGEILLVRCRD